MIKIKFLEILLLSILTFQKEVRFNSDGKFKIIQITDIHYGETDPEKDPKTTVLMRKLIEWEKPDLAVLTGDMVSGFDWDKSIDNWYEE